MLYEVITDPEGVRGYVAHRLLVAGHQGGALFSASALKLLAQGSRGIPRLINILSHKALLAAYGQGQRHVTAMHLRAAVRDTEDAEPVLGSFLPWVYGGLTFMILLEISALVYFVRGGVS